MNEQLDLTWTIQRIDQRTPLGRHGADQLRLLVAGWERVSRYGASTGPGERAGTSALVPYACTERSTRLNACPTIALP